MFANEIKAQLIEGRYFLTKKEYLDPPRFGNYSEIIIDDNDSIHLQLYKHYERATLDVYDNREIYLKTCSSGDLGNFSSFISGDYKIELTPVGNNVYEAKNNLIHLMLTMRQDGEIEILIYNRIIFWSRRGIFNIDENVPVDENIRYFFTRKGEIKDVSTEEKICDVELESMIEHLGINYGGYRVVRQKVIFEDPTSCFEKKDLREVERVDLRTFEVHMFFHSAFPQVYTDYAKDAERAFYQGETIENVDPNDFIIINPLHAKTSKNIYFKNAIIPNAEVETFEILYTFPQVYTDYAKDAERVFYQGEVIPNADVETFELLNHVYARDKNRYYRDGKIIKKDKNVRELLKRMNNYLKKNE